MPRVYHKTGRTHGEVHKLAKLTNEAVVEIFLSREKYPYLAALYGVSTSAIQKVKNRTSWTHITKHLDSVPPSAKQRRPRKVV